MSTRREGGREIGREGKKVKRERKEEQEGKRREEANSPFYSARHSWLLPGNCGGQSLDKMLTTRKHRSPLTIKYWLNANPRFEVGIHIYLRKGHGHKMTYNSKIIGQ